ncbi:MAG: phosphoserine phosphatase SerB [Minwuia sp.]|uniref:phosphoserine phosphatase SerB n=1 Tax=Minwuia sp. TaxID=2493630 RepID=UPI003A88B117
MPTVLTLVAGEGQLRDEALLAELAGLAPVQRQRELVAKGVFEIFYNADDPAVLRPKVANIIGERPIDFCIRRETPEGHWKLLIADMDSTMITVECIDELGDFAGVREQVVAITERAMRGEIDFEGALAERVALMKGLPESALAECFDTRVKLSPGAREMVQGCRAAGMHCALVSGGFTYFTERVAGLCGFHENRANRLLFEEGVLTGKVAEPILGRQAKIESLDELCTRLGIRHDQAVCIGDGANDIGMIEKAGLGVAYRAKPITKNAADCAIDHGGLDVLLRFLGV